ncbi:unnamed protein product [Linum tenue]|uniref:Uncharacterized protein n=1 Tax=Linum tenue TaxID=586396 RepID=A0AAV0S5P4_9ROSI|nr:unnamed protein product [Linum tenue]CAI0628463.1 unnamed protein product [Linum tenue]
MLLALHQLT